MQKKENPEKGNDIPVLPGEEKDLPGKKNEEEKNEKLKPERTGNPPPVKPIKPEK